MNKSVEKRRKALEEYRAIFKGLSKDEGIDFIEENVPNKKLSRAVMSAFIECCGTAADKTWMRDTFLVKAYDMVDGEKVYNQKLGKELFLTQFEITLSSKKDSFDEFAFLATIAPETGEKSAPKAKKD